LSLTCVTDSHLFIYLFKLTIATIIASFYVYVSYISVDEIYSSYLTYKHLMKNVVLHVHTKSLK